MADQPNNLGDYTYIAFDNQNSAKLRIRNDSAGIVDISTVEELRDIGQWSHYLIVLDTNHDISSERYVVYINGVRVDEFTTNTALAQGSAPVINSNDRTHYIGGGQIGSSGLHWQFEGEMTEAYFVDGLRLTPDVFGYYKTDGGRQSVGGSRFTKEIIEGRWRAKPPQVIKNKIDELGGFGTTGYYLPMNEYKSPGADFHTTPNTIIKVNEDLLQPEATLPNSTAEGYTDILRDDPYKGNLIAAIPFIEGGLNGGYGDYSGTLRGTTNKTASANGSAFITNSGGPFYGTSAYFQPGTGENYFEYDLGTSLGSGEFTIECWVRLPNVSLMGCWRSILNLGSYNSTGGLSLFAPGTNSVIDNTFVYIVNNVNPTAQAKVTINDNSWHHIVLERWNGSNSPDDWANTRMIQYVDGIPCSLRTDSVAATNLQGTTLRVGKDFGCGSGVVGGQFHGWISDVRIYKGVAKYKGTAFDVPRPWTGQNIANNKHKIRKDTFDNIFNCWNRNDSYNIGLEHAGTKLVEGGNSAGVRSLFGVSSGKWYAEFYKVGTESNHQPPRVMTPDIQLGHYNGYHGYDSGNNRLPGDKSVSAGYCYNDVGFQVGQDQTQSLVDNNYQGASQYIGQGDVLGYALDADNKTLTCYKNGIEFKFINWSQYLSYDTLLFGSSQYQTWSNYDWIANFGQDSSFAGYLSSENPKTDQNDKGEFFYEPPSGYLAMCTDNFGEPSIKRPQEHQDVLIYEGDNENPRKVTGLEFEPDWVLMKELQRADQWILFDRYRGPKKYMYLAAANGTGLQDGAIASFDPDGFTLGETPWNNLQTSGIAVGNWAFKGSGEITANNDGDITSYVCVNQEAGFSIVAYTGNGSNSPPQGIGHGLGKTPKFILHKRWQQSTNWYTYHYGMNTGQYQEGINTTNGGATAAIFGSSASYLPNDTVTYVNQSNDSNGSGEKYIQYTWAEVEGYSKFGLYQGNGNAFGPYVYCGFKPALIILKRFDDVGNWIWMDFLANPKNPGHYFMVPNSANGYDTGGVVDRYSTGFKLRLTSTNFNASTGKYFFCAWAESPFKYVNGRG